MGYERDDYMRRQEADHEMIRMRDPRRSVFQSGPHPDSRDEMIADLVAALRQIANPLDCGCVPCVGQCRSEVALEIEVEARQDIARAALTKAGVS